MRHLGKIQPGSPLRHFFITLAVALGCQPPIAALADNVGDIRLGESIARKDCSLCHQIDQRKPQNAKPGPSFAAIAKMDSATYLSIRVFLRSTHQKKTMPNLVLSDDEIDAVAEYILSQRPR